MNSAEHSPINESRVSLEDSTQRSVLPEWEIISLGLQALKKSQAWRSRAVMIGPSMLNLANGWMAYQDDEYIEGQPWESIRFAYYKHHIFHTRMANFISFTIRPAPWDPNKKLVHPTGYPVEAPPIYSIGSSKSTSPNVVLFLGWGAGPHEVIGDGKFPKSFHSTCHLTLHGQPLEMRSSQSGSGDCKFDHPFFGHMKWKADMISSSKMELRDGHGRRVATFGKGKSGEKTLDIIQGDPYFMELVLLSGITAINLNKGMGDAAVEIFSAIAGA